MRKNKLKFQRLFCPQELDDIFFSAKTKIDLKLSKVFQKIVKKLMTYLKNVFIYQSQSGFRPKYPDKVGTYV